MTEQKITNSLADFLHRHRDNRELLEGVVDAVEIIPVQNPEREGFSYVSSFRVNPTLRNPYAKRRYFFVVHHEYNSLPPCELAVDDEVKINIGVENPDDFYYYKPLELANMTTGRVYKIRDETIEVRTE